MLAQCARFDVHRVIVGVLDRRSRHALGAHLVERQVLHLVGLHEDVVRIVDQVRHDADIIRQGDGTTGTVGVHDGAFAPKRALILVLDLTTDLLAEIDNELIVADPAEARNVHLGRTQLDGLLLEIARFADFDIVFALARLRDAVGNLLAVRRNLDIAQGRARGPFLGTGRRLDRLGTRLDRDAQTGHGHRNTERRCQKCTFQHVHPPPATRLPGPCMSCSTKFRLNTA